MPKAGRYDYPSRDLDSCVEYLRTAYEVKKTLSMPRDSFGEAVHISNTSGPFGGLVGSLAQYGLVDTGEGMIKYTELGKTVIAGSQTEVEQAKNKAARKVNLFADIYARFGAQVTDEQLRLFLKDIAGVDVVEAPKQAGDVGKIFKKVSRYLESENAAEAKQKVNGDQNMSTNKQPDENGFGEINGDKYIPYRLAEGIVIKIPKELTEDVLQQAWKKSKAAMDIFLDVKVEN